MRAFDRWLRPARPATLGFVRAVAFADLVVALACVAAPTALEIAAIAAASLALLGVRTRFFVPLGVIGGAAVLAPGLPLGWAGLLPVLLGAVLSFTRAGDGWSLERLVTLMRAEPVPDPERAVPAAGRALFAARTAIALGLGAVVGDGLAAGTPPADPPGTIGFALPLLLAFADVPALLRRAGRAFRRVRGPVHVLYDGQCPLCRRTQRLLQALDLFARLDFHDFRRLDLAAHAAEHGIAITPEELEQEMAVHRSGTRRSGFDAARSLAWSLPALWPLAPLLHLPGAARPGRAIYRWIALNRMRF